MKKLILYVLTLTSLTSIAQNKNINLLSNLYINGGVNDVWGMKKGANEYAFVGTDGGVSIIDVTNPTNPIQVFFVPGVSSLWRDLKTWNNHLYVTNETSGGLMIIDLNPLPGALTMANVTNFTGSTFPFQSAHNLYIDENGICYVFGADNGVGGAIILNLTNNPQVPIELGRFNDFYLHDGVVRGDTLWGAAISDGFFAAIDVSIKSNPVVMVVQNTSNNFTHNIWFSDNGQTIFTTDEVNGAFIEAYDVSNLSNITLLDKVQSNPGSNSMPHNAHFINDFVVTSYYADGVTIHDVSDPSNIIEVGNYDTFPFMSTNFVDGAWGAYPWLPSGNLLVSDMQNGLFVLGPTYIRAARLEGNVTNAFTSVLLDNVLVELLATNVNTTSNLIGNYKTGIVDAGIYNIVYSKAGFVSDTIFNLTLTNGATVIQNVQLIPLATSITENKNQTEFKIYPNPSNGVFTITAQKQTIFDVTVFDMLGKIVYTKTNNNESLDIDLISQKQGIYFLTIKSDDYTVTQKIIISN